jgi:hypothetical protein
MGEQRRREGEDGEQQDNEVGQVNVSIALPLSSPPISRAHNRSPPTHDGLNVVQDMHRISRYVGHSIANHYTSVN